ncbi:MAG TPA: hypothetical protein VH815_08710 [Acidobacteriota bacterium]|jgi:hypothetical protein
MENSTFLMRNGNDEYTLYTFDVNHFGSIKTLSKMNEPLLHMVVTCLQKIHSEDKPAPVYFPKNENIPEMMVCIQKRGKNNIILALNLGSFLLSEMTDEEFHEIVFELETIPLQPIGTKVYFPPLKGKDEKYS